MPNPFDPASGRAPMSRDERAFLIVFLAIVFGLFAAEVVTDYEPVKLGVLLFPIFWGILIAVHEAGHAIAARICGWEVDRIVVGFGKTVGRFEVAGIGVELRIIPIEGFASLHPIYAPNRFARAFIYFAGPGIELVVAGLIIWTIGWDAFTARNQEYNLVVAQTFAGAALAGAVLNLIPAGVRTEGGMVPNDGLGIIQSLFGRGEPRYND